MCCWCIYLPCSGLHRLFCCPPCTIVLHNGSVFLTHTQSSTVPRTLPRFRAPEKPTRIYSLIRLLSSSTVLDTCGGMRGKSLGGRAVFGSSVALEEEGRKGGHHFAYSSFTMPKRRQPLQCKDGKPRCRGAACNQCPHLSVEGPANAQATSALLRHTWAAKFSSNRKYPG